jgi:uncharacterized membrane protein YoaK (UPF0700 family)
LKPWTSTLLSFNGGYVDTAGFLALQGLFTAHVTGNFVTFGASAVLGTSGIIAKLLALPTFCIVVIGSRLLGHALRQRNLDPVRVLLISKLLLLVLSAWLAVQLGPFTNGDSWKAILTGLSLVAAMAIQNKIQRVHLGSSPPSTLMTGTTTQIMVDLADLLAGFADAAANSRIKRLAAAVLSFALGCGVAAALFLGIGMHCFWVPPLVLLIFIILRDRHAIDDRANPA